MFKLAAILPLTFAIVSAGNLQPRVYEAPRHVFPFVVSIRTADTDTHFCTGSITGRNSIVTAASCFQDETRNTAEKVVVVLDVHIIDSYEGTRLPIKNIIIHPEYDSTKAIHNLAILHTKINVEHLGTYNFFDRDESHYIMLGPLNLDSELFGVGWGFEDSNIEDVFGPLKYTHLSVTKLKNDYCQNGELFFCVEPLDGTSIFTNGSVGGPVVQTIEEKMVLVGIISSNTFEPVTTITRVSSYRKWIAENSGYYTTLNNWIHSGLQLLPKWLRYFL